VNSHLSEFRFTPMFVLVAPTQFVVQWRPAWERRTDPPKALTGEELCRVQPSTAAKSILDLMDAGMLNRVRQCMCGRWFYAQSAKKVVCSAACRFRKFKNADQDTYNKQRAEYMRGYRKNPKVKSKTRKEKASGGPE
jgi:hypothetical protein